MSDPASKIIRFTKGNPCPICGGTDQDARGTGERCFGFRSGKWIHCSREEYAGRARFAQRSQTYAHVATGPCPCGEEHAPAELVLGRRKGTLVKAYPYQRGDGTVAYETVRFKDPKGFAQRRPDGAGGYIWNLHGVGRVLYRLPKLNAADRFEVVWICEGEKDAERLESFGLLATTCAEGAGKWRSEYSEVLRDRTVAILPHNDEPGHKDGQQKAQSLYGKAASVRVVDLPGVPENGGDVSNWLDGGGTIDRLRELLRETAEWTPLIGGVAPLLPTNGEPGGDGRTLWLPDGGINYGVLTAVELNIQAASSIKIKPINWIWPYRLAAGEIGLIAGEGGLGKSQLMLWVVAAVSRGWAWPDKSGNAPIGPSLIVTAEDSPETTIVPRLMAMGADLDKVFITTAPKAMIQEVGKESFIKFESLGSLGYWRRAMELYPDLLLIVVDPITSFLGKGIDANSNEEVRSVMEPFSEQILRPGGRCLLVNTHLNKSTDAKRVLDRINNSVAFRNVPRNVHVVLRDENDPDRATRVFGQGKCNNAPDNLPSLKFKIERREVASDGGVIETSTPVFLDELFAVDLNRVMAGEKGHKGPRPVASSRFADWLFEELKKAGVPVMVRYLIADAQEAELMTAPTEACPKPSISPLYNAMRRLKEVHAGWDVEEVGVEGRKAWRLFRIDGADQPETEHADPAF
jgi:hypothetical protein